MNRTTRHISFSEIRNAYALVKDFLALECAQEISGLNIKIAEDLKMLGDDNYELLEKFVENFELGYDSFEYDKHFFSEGELFGSSTFLNQLLAPEQINGGKLDLTFKDLLKWYLEKDFAKAMNVTYWLKNSSIP